MALDQLTTRMTTTALAINNRTLCGPGHMGLPIIRIHFAPSHPESALTDCSHHHQLHHLALHSRGAHSISGKGYGIVAILRHTNVVREYEIALTAIAKNISIT